MDEPSTSRDALLDLLETLVMCEQTIVRLRAHHRQEARALVAEVKTLQDETLRQIATALARERVETAAP